MEIGVYLLRKRQGVRKYLENNHKIFPPILVTIAKFKDYIDAFLKLHYLCKLLKPFSKFRSKGVGHRSLMLRNMEYSFHLFPKRHFKPKRVKRHYLDMIGNCKRY